MHQAIESFWSSQYAPHGYCLLWRPDLILTHLVSDILIALAYFSIPFALVRLVRRRPDVDFGLLFWLFAIFIFACGMTHVMAAWNLWHGNYGLEGVIKGITAAASVPTAIVLWKLLPRAMLIPSPSELQRANERLSAMVMERDLAVKQLNAEMSERQRAEAALIQVQKIDAIGQLTGGIAHDFNNLLQAISGNIELIVRNLDQRESISRWSDNALKAVERGAKLAGQLLVFARVQQLDRVKTDVKALVSGMTDLIERSIGPKVRVELHFGDSPCEVLTEPNQLELAILNLSINARDAMPDGGRLRITVDPAGDDLPPGLPPGDYVRVAVEDDGCGMSDEVAAQAINPFFTTKGVGKGTGLGLSMAYGFARQMNGVLTLASAPGEGTTVSLYLPTADGAEAAEAAEAARDMSARPMVRPPTTGDRGGAIVVDDDDDVRPLIVEMLSSLGFTVTAFASPIDALDQADWGASQLIFLDYMMPGMDGAELARRVRERHPDKRIVFITGYADRDEVGSLIDTNSRLLRKPFNVGDLETLVAEFG